MNDQIQEAYKALINHWGEQHWWPAKTRFEMMLGAILTQNTTWSNAEKALSNLRKNDMLKFETLGQISEEQLSEWIRPAGYFNQKSGYIKEMIKTIHERFNGSIVQLFALDTPTLRSELLSWKGIGPETADSILLYAGKRPIFVVDAYTKRVGDRHGWCDKNASYDSVARLFTSNVPEDVLLYNEYHALIVKLCKEHCTARSPKCGGCPLEPLLIKTNTKAKRV